MKALLASVLILTAAHAAAQPVKCVDAKGHVRYIDQSMAAQEKCEPVTATTNTVPMQPGAIKPPPPARGAASYFSKLLTSEARAVAAWMRSEKSEPLRMSCTPMAMWRSSSSGVYMPPMPGNLPCRRQAAITLR